MAGPSTSSTVLIVGISVTSVLVVFMIILITLLVLRWRKNTKGRDLENQFSASIRNDMPINTLDMRMMRSTYRPLHAMSTFQVQTRSTYLPNPPPVHISQHPTRAVETLYAEPQLYTVSKRTPSHYATISGNSVDLDDYPYAIVNTPMFHRDVDSMRSSTGVDLGTQYQKVPKRASSHYATISSNSADLDEYPYAIVNQPAPRHVPRVSNVDSMRSSAGVDLGAQYQKVDDSQFF